MTIKAASILAAGFVAGAIIFGVLVGGIYTTQLLRGGAAVMRTNRITGAVSVYSEGVWVALREAAK